MNYLKFPLHYQRTGATIEVQMTGVESDVLLLDAANLAAFERGRQTTYYGGHYNASPVLLRVPSSGNWNVVVVPGPGGEVRASVWATAA